MHPKLKLTYFDGPGRAEAIRLTLYVCGIDCDLLAYMLPFYLMLMHYASSLLNNRLEASPSRTSVSTMPSSLLPKVCSPPRLAIPD
jgi:hypothetical protein